MGLLLGLSILCPIIHSFFDSDTLNFSPDADNIWHPKVGNPSFGYITPCSIPSYVEAAPCLYVVANSFAILPGPKSTGAHVPARILLS